MDGADAFASVVRPSHTPSVSVTPTVVKSGSWVTVAFRAPAAALNLSSNEYVCVQDSYCENFVNLSLWVGMFAKGANRSVIGPQDWVCGNPPWLATRPIKWKPLNAAAGAVRFHVESMRVPDFEYVLFSNGTTWPIELAVSQPLHVTDNGAPQHLRLARTKSANEMRVSWSAAHHDADTVVRWGFSSGHYQHSTSASASTYSKADLCGPPATTHGWWPAPWSYSAVVSFGAPAPSRLYYIAGSDQLGWTEERSFVPPQPPSRTASLHFTAIANMGETYVDGAQYHWMEPFALNTTGFVIRRWDDEPGHTPLALRPMHPTGDGRVQSGKEGPPRGHTMAQLARKVASGAGSAPTDLLLHIGDLAYSTGYESEWDRFMAQIEPYHLARRT